MDNCKRRKKVIIEIMLINEHERHRRFEIKLPTNVKRVTGVIITTTQLERPG